MKKIISVTSVLVLCLWTSNAMMDMWATMGGMENMWADITNSVMWSMSGLEDSMNNLDSTMDQLDANMEKMMEWFDSWEDNFEDMMSDFETKLEDSLEVMEKRIESMMDWMMKELDSEMEKMELELDKISENLSDNIVSVLDTKLDNYFNKIDSKTSWDEEYIEKLTNLTDKVDELEQSWKLSSDLLKNAVNYIGQKADINKQETVTSNIINTKNKDVEDISKDDLEALKWLFDMLED